MWYNKGMKMEKGKKEKIKGRPKLYEKTYQKEVNLTEKQWNFVTKEAYKQSLIKKRTISASEIIRDALTFYEENIRNKK